MVNSAWKVNILDICAPECLDNVCSISSLIARTVHVLTHQAECVTQRTKSYGGYG